MAKSGQCCGNFWMWAIGCLALGFWWTIGGFVATFGLWQLGIDETIKSIDMFKPTGMADNESYKKMLKGVQPGGPFIKPY